MNTDSALKNKVYAMLADYSSSEFQTTMQTLNPPEKDFFLQKINKISN